MSWRPGQNRTNTVHDKPFGYWSKKHFRQAQQARRGFGPWGTRQQNASFWGVCLLALPLPPLPWEKRVAEKVKQWQEGSAEQPPQKSAQLLNTKDSSHAEDG